MTTHPKSSLTGAIRAYADEARASLGNDRPSAELLDTYLRGELSDVDRRRLVRRISLDPELATELLDRQQREMLRQKQEDWRVLASRAEAASDRLTSELTSSSTSVHDSARATTSGRFVFAVAAGWILTAVGLGIWIYRLETAKANGSVNLASRGPFLETHVLSKTLRPDGRRRETDGTEPPLRIDTTTERVTLFLLSADPRSFTTYSVELRDPQGGLLTEGLDLRRAEDGSFTVSFDPTPLSAGRYELVVLGHDAGEPRMIGRYPFHIEMAGD